MTNLDSILKSRDTPLPTKVWIVKANGFSSSHVWMWELTPVDSKVSCKESWALKNWCFWTVVLEKTLVSPLDWSGWRQEEKAEDRGWDGWMASPTQWTWVWVNSGSWWWTGRPGVLQAMGLQRVGHDWVTELNWFTYIEYEIFAF